MTGKFSLKYLKSKSYVPTIGISIWPFFKIDSLKLFSFHISIFTCLELAQCPLIRSQYIWLKNEKNFSAIGKSYWSLVLERTPKYWTSNTPNIEYPNIELSKHHILAQNRTSNMSNITKTWTVREHQTVSSKTSLVT